jgi:hypothetical protein
MKVKLSTGKVVEISSEYGPRETLRAAELASVPADMSLADQMLYNIATIMVVVKNVQAKDDPEPKTIEDLIGKNVESRDMLLAFREAFTNGEWQSLAKAIAKVTADPKSLDEGEFEILT